MRFVIFVIFMILSSRMFADSYNLADKLSLNTCKNNPAHLFFIYNKSTNPVWLVGAQKKDSASAGWSTQIYPSKWTVILMYHPNFAFSCYANDLNKSVACEKYLRVYKNARYLIPNSAVGQSYFVAESVDKDTLPNQLRARNFIEKP